VEETMSEVTRRDLLKAAAAGVIGSAAAACGGTPPVEEKKGHPPVVDKLIIDAPAIDASDRAARIERARMLMSQNRLDAIVVTGGSGLLYFGGFDWWQSERLFALIVPRLGAPAIVAPAFEKARASELANPDWQIHTWEEDENPFQYAAKAFRELGLRAPRIGIEERVRFFESDGLAKTMPEATFLSADPVTIGCRAVKTDKELEIMRRANQLTLKAYAAAVKRFAAGMTEDDTRAIVSEEFVRLGSNGGAFILHGPNSAFPHGTQNRRPLKDGDVVLMDGGCKINGYASDITRTIVFGAPTSKQVEVWNLVKTAQTKALEAAVAGNTCGSVDDAARGAIEAGGYGPGYTYFTHRLGHGIGLDGHEWPYLVRGNQLPLAPGMTFSNEPGIYLYGEFGIRLEDCMYIGADGSGKLFTEQSPSIELPF
jgi:Xaa-Pro dipeptidase